MSLHSASSESAPAPPAPPAPQEASSLTVAPWRGVRAAFAFLSRIPVGGHPYTAPEMAAAPAYFPLVGLTVGGAGGLVVVVAARLGPYVAAVLAVLVTVLMTGAFHEDGLGDTADGLGGAHGGKRALEIMKDSRIGSYGAVAICFSLCLRIAALGGLAPKAAGFAMIFAHTLARTVPVAMMAFLPYVSTDSSKSRAVSAVSRGQLLIAAVLCFAVTGLLGGAGVVPVKAIGGAALAVLLAALVLGRWFVAKIGGITGDLLGATEQVAESLTLVVVLGFA